MPLHKEELDQGIYKVTIPEFPKEYYIANPTKEGNISYIKHMIRDEFVYMMEHQEILTVEEYENIHTKVFLIACNEWLANCISPFGPVNKIIHEAKPTLFLYKGKSLSAALKLIKEYQVAYKAYYKNMSLEFTLISVQTVPFEDDLFDSLVDLNATLLNRNFIDGIGER